jgi:hypothetical protein
VIDEKAFALTPTPLPTGEGLRFSPLSLGERGWG